MLRAEPKAIEQFGVTGQINKLARKAVHSMFSGLSDFRLKLTETFATPAQVSEFGSGTPQIELKVHHPNFYKRTLFAGNIGAAESYIDQEWDCSDLTELVRLLAKNTSSKGKLESLASNAMTFVSTVSHHFRHNNIDNARHNILQHYDLSNSMYQRFLDPRMVYSSALYPRPDASLEEAQTHKLKVICDKLQLSSSDHLLEIGTGWGGLAVFAAKHYGCKVTTTTISNAQFDYAKNLIEQEGLENQITLLNQDYRLLEGSFDKLVSIEMIEAVGHEYLPKFFDSCNALVKDGGLMLIQAITYKDQEYADYLKKADFIQKHIFPGGCLLSTADLLQQYMNYTSMDVLNIETFGLHYARTLKDWRANFTAAKSQIKDMGFDARFLRLWEYYFSYCEGGFLSGRINVGHFLSQKQGGAPADTSMSKNLA